MLNTVPGDLPRSFYIAQHPVHKRAAATTLPVNSRWPSCLAGTAKKAILGKYCLFIAYLSADSCLASLEIAGFNSHVCRDRFLKVPSSKKQPTHPETGGQICFDTGTPFHMLSVPTDLQKLCSENGMFIQQQATSNLCLPCYIGCSQRNQQQNSTRLG